MVYRLVCSLVYGMCIASGGFAAAQSADTVKEEPAVQTEDKNEAAASEPTQEANSEIEVKPAATVLETKESEEQIQARKKKINELIEQAESQLYGEGVPVDLSKAAVLYGQAADLGSPKAMMRLSALYRKGTGVEQSQEKALELIQKAASLDYAPAQAALGISYLEGRGVEKDENLGYDWIRKAAENGHALSRVMTGERLLSQADNEQSKQTGQEYIDSILLNASPQELYTISYSFGHGLRLTKNPEKARYWAKAAADKGSVNGTYYLGELYWNAKEVPEALKCFEKAAEMGLTAAELQTGRIYLYGADGVPKNPAKAVYWMKKAAPIASNEDLLTLVGLELSGPRAVKNHEDAQKYLDMYIARAKPEELEENAEKYWNGIGVRKNFDIGGALALAAVQKGNKANVCSYAMKLATPNWLGGDPVTAYAILNDCVLQKDAPEDQVKAFEALEKRMSAEDLRKAQNLNGADAIEVIKTRRVYLTGK